MSNKPERLIMISFDALSTYDFKALESLPHFSQFLTKASYCKKVYSVYPTLTYPAHTSIVTGRYPKNHGIINNTLLQPKRANPDWYWQRKYVKGTTLYDEAILKGMKVASLLWPVTAKSRIQYNMPEVLANRPWQNQIIASLLNGTPHYQYLMNKKFGHLRKGTKQPYLDNFTHQAVLYTIKNIKPDLMLIHYTDLDTIRHNHGVDSLEAKAALERHDQRLGEIITMLKEEGLFNSSAIVLLGDHSQLDESKVIYLNTLFRGKGWLDIDGKGRIVKWKVIGKNCDGSTYVYVNDKEDSALRQELKNLFELVKKEYGIEHIYTRDEAEALGADPSCAFMLEAKKGYYFLDEIEDQTLKEIHSSEVGYKKHITAATHGYSPYKEDYTTVFMAAGSGIKPNIEIEKMNLIDEGPTLAKLLGLDLGKVDGRVIEEILAD